MENERVSEYTNSVQHNVLATAIDRVNNKKSLTYLDKSKIGTGENLMTKDIPYEISTLHGMTEILKEIHALGYKIVKGK